MARTTVADVVVGGLRRAGVARVFAAASGPLAAALTSARHLPLTVVHATTPAAAAIMAAVTAELSDAPGVMVAEHGEDASGLGYAARSRAPVIVLTSEAPPECVAGLKAVVVVEPASAAHWVAHAIQSSLSHPRGPVELVIPAGVEIQAALPVATALRPERRQPSPAELEQAARAIAGASRPVLVVGTESRWPDAAPWIRPFAEALPAPVVSAAKGKGVLADPHPLAFGLLGSAVAATLLASADLVVTLGLDAMEAPPAAWPATTPVVRIGTADAEAAGDVGLVLEELAPRLRGGRSADWDVAELDRLKRLTRRASAGEAVDPARVVGIARELTAPGTIAAIDLAGGGASMTGAWETVAPHELFIEEVTGFATAAARAAALHRVDRRVLAFTARSPSPSVVGTLPPNVTAVAFDGDGAAEPEPVLRAALTAALAAPGARVVVVARRRPR